VEARLEAADRAQVDGKEIEEQRPLVSVASEINLPRVSGSTLPYTISRFVVLPPSPGP